MDNCPLRLEVRPILLFHLHAGVRALSLDSVHDDTEFSETPILRPCQREISNIGKEAIWVHANANVGNPNNSAYTSATLLFLN